MPFKKDVIDGGKKKVKGIKKSSKKIKDATVTAIEEAASPDALKNSASTIKETSKKTLDLVQIEKAGNLAAQAVNEGVKVLSQDSSTPDVKELKDAITTMKEVASSNPKDFLKKSTSSIKKLPKKSVELVNNNQEEIEKVANLACPGGGLAAHAVIQGVKFVSSKTEGKELKDVVPTIKKVASSNPKDVLKKSASIIKESPKKSLELVNNNQKEIEKVANLAIPGGGLAAHAVFEGVKVVSKTSEGKGIKDVVPTMKEVASTNPKDILKNSKSSIKKLPKKVQLVNNNQEEIEKVANLTCPGAGLAAHAVFEGVKVVSKHMN